MTRFYFDVWPADDLLGTALGELTQAYNRTWQRVDQAMGSGQFTINRHDSQYTDDWCAQDNLVRVRLVAGGPFAADDARYVHAFFIEEGDDDAVSEQEEGGEEITRGGRDAVVILRRAVMSYEADFGGDDGYASKTLVDGNWHFKNRNAGNVLRICLRNASARTPDPLDPMTMDFNTSHDTSGADWSDSDADWNIPVGQDLLEVLGTLASGDTYWQMGPDLVLHAWDEDPGADVSGSVSFTAGVNIREAAQRQVHAREGASWMLVQGTAKDGKLTYKWVSSSSAETILGGRREGFVEYQATPTDARLTKAGRRAITSSVKQHQGPTTLGVEEQGGDPVAFTDYVPGDSITVDIPGIWDEVVAKVYGVQMDEDDAGDALVTVILEEQPFDPASGANTDDGLGDGTGNGAGCGKCPPPPPYQPGTQPGEGPPPNDGSITICNTVPVDGNREASGVSTISVIAGQVYTYRISQPEHSNCSGTEDLLVDSSNADGYIFINVHEYGWPWGAGGAGPEVRMSGTFTTPSTGPGSGGPGITFRVSARTGGYAAPCIGPFGRDCWQYEIWHGIVDLDGLPEEPIPPSPGQPVTGETPTVAIGASTTTLTVDWPYAAGSLRIRVDGVLISPASYAETTPGSGVVTLSWALDADETVTIDYQAAT